MDSSSDRRCKRNAGPKWRCSEAASPGKSYCDKHLLQRKNQSNKRIIHENKGENENNKRSRITVKVAADDLSTGSDLIEKKATNQILNNKKKIVIDQVS